MLKKRSIISGILAASLLFGAVTGCSSGSSSSAAVSGAAATGTSSTQAAGKGEKVTFTLWDSYVGSDQRATFMADAIQRFKTAYPNYEIQEQKMPVAQYKTKLKTQAAAGQLPDAFTIWPNAMTKEFASSNLITDINDRLAKDTKWKDSFIPRALDEFTVDGKTYSAGLGVSLTSIVFYNQKLFDQYKVKVPTTFDELKAAISTFKSKSIIPIALGNKDRWEVQSCIFSCLANRETGSDWLTNALAKKNNAKFTDAGFVKALDDIKTIAKLGGFNPDYNTIDDTQVRQYFYQQKAAMLIDGSWVLNDMVKNAPSDLKSNIKMTVMPSFGGKGDATTMCGVSSTGIAINAKASAQQKNAIEDFIVFLTNEDSQKKYAESAIPLSSKNADISSVKVDSLYSQMNQLMKDHQLVTVYDSALNSEMVDIIENGLQSVMMGQQTPEAVAKAMQDAVK